MQWEKIMEFMNSNPDIARGKPRFGMSKTLLNEKFDELAIDLNNIGPPERSSKEWQRV